MNIALILAKGGSIGLPDKNLLEFQGLPLLAHTIIEVQKSACFDEVYVTTNDQAIADVAQQYKAQVIRRSDEYAHNDRYIDSVNHAINQISLPLRTITIPQVVQPLREPGIFERMLSLHSPRVHSVVTVSRFESSVNWIYARDDETDQLAQLDQIDYRQDLARRDDLFIIDNAIVSFTYTSWQSSEGITSWPYLGKRIIAVEQKHLNTHYNVDINVADDAEWLEFVALYPQWRESRGSQ